MVVHEITDRLDPAPTHRRLTKQAPGDLGKFLSVAVSTPQQKNERLFGQMLDRMLLRGRRNNIRLAGILDDSCAGYSDLPLRGDETRAPVAEAITIGRQRNRRECYYMVRN